MRGKEFEVKNLLEKGKTEQQVGLLCRLLHFVRQKLKLSDCKLCLSHHHKSQKQQNTQRRNQRRVLCRCPGLTCCMLAGVRVGWPGGAWSVRGEKGFTWEALSSDLPCVCRLPTNSSPELMLPRLLRKKLPKRDETPYKKPMTFSTTWKVWEVEVTG